MATDTLIAELLDEAESIVRAEPPVTRSRPRSAPFVEQARRPTRR